MPKPPLPVSPGLPPVPQQQLGFGRTNPAQNAPVPPTAWDLSEQRLTREKSDTTGDYTGSIWRQDGLADGIVANLAGNEMMPDPNYSPFKDPNWAELTKGVWPDLVNNLYEAHSAAHALYIKDRLLQKQEDLTRLGDLGWKGDFGRIALNAVMPDQLLMAMAGGWAARGVTAVRGARAAEMALSASRAPAIAGGIAVGAAENAGFEKLRQSVNFEDSTAGVLEAGLMGAAFTTPFAVAGSRRINRVAAAADKEQSVLRSILDETPAAPEDLRQVQAAHIAIREFQAGHLDEAGVEKAMNELVGHEPEPAQENKPTSAAEEAVTLYRAESPTVKFEDVFNKEGLPDFASDKPGTRFTDDPKYAEYFRKSYGPDATVRSIQVPKSVAEAGRINGYEYRIQESDGHPHEAYVGREVSWAGPEGDTLEGTVKSFNPEIGKLIVKTDEGMKSVHASALDQFEGEAPTGFLKGSVGAAQVAPVAKLADQRTALAEFTLPGTDIKVPTRFDIYAQLNASPVGRIRELGFKLVKDAIQNDKFEAQGMTASEWKKQVQRTVSGRFHVQADEAFNEARKLANVPFWKSDSYKQEFYSNVSRVTRGDLQVLTDNAAVAGPLKKAAAAQAEVYATLIKQAKEAGVKGADQILPNDLYVNRVWHHGNIREAEALHGKDSIHRLIADSIQNPADIIDRARKSPGKQGWTDDQILLGKAKGFLNAVKSLEFNRALRDMPLAGRDMATLRGELKGLGVKDSHVDDLIDLMFEVRPHEADAGRAGQLKFRFALDESHGMKTPAGQLRLSDLFENDARVLTDVYTNSMGGHIGLAKKGLPDQAAFAREMKLAADEAVESGAHGGDVAKSMALMDMVHKNILGQPTNTDAFSTSARLASAFRGYTRAVMLPQLGIAAAFEMNKAIAMMGFKSLQQLPSFRSLLIGLRQGYLPEKGLARDIQLLSGFGNEMAASYHRGQEIENGFFGQTLTRVETGSNRASHAVDVLSGNASFTSLTKQLTGMMATQNMFDHANGKKLSGSMRERWVGQGINDDDIDHVLGRLKEFSDNDKGRVTGIRYEDWHAADPKSYEQFQTFLSRQVRDAIQDHDLGETMPFMHSTLGKVVSELKTFFLVAHAKNFLKQLNYRDATALQVWTIGFIGEALGYMTQAAINYPTDLQNKLTPEKIATAAFFRMSSMGTASMLAETGYNILSGGESLVQPGMTANTDNRSFLNTPSLMVGKRLLNAPSTLFGLATGNNVTTRTEGQDLWGSIPGGNLYGLKAAGQWWVNSLPKVDPDHPGQR